MLFDRYYSPLQPALQLNRIRKKENHYGITLLKIKKLFIVDYSGNPPVNSQICPPYHMYVLILALINPAYHLQAKLNREQTIYAYRHQVL